MSEPTTPLEIEDIAGLSLSITGTLVESFVKNGFADPTMYKALRASAELAEHFRARAIADGKSEELVKACGELMDSLMVTAMECGEVVEKIIEENGWQERMHGWDSPTCEDSDCNLHGRLDDENQNG